MTLRKMLEPIMLMLIMVLWMTTTGCGTLFGPSKTDQLLAQSQLQTQLAAKTQQTVMTALKEGSVILPEFPAEMPNIAGSVGYVSIKRAIYDKAGNVVLDKDGIVQFETGTVLGKSDRMVDITGVQEIWYTVGGMARNQHTGEVAPGVALDGVFVHARGESMAGMNNAEFAAVWADKPVAEKQAAADAVRQALEQKRGAVVEAITAAGTVATGVLTEIYRATPIGVGLAAVDVLISTDEGNQRATIVEPLPPPGD